MFCKDRGIDFTINNNYCYIKIKKRNHSKGNALYAGIYNAINLYIMQLNYSTNFMK